MINQYDADDDDDIRIHTGENVFGGRKKTPLIICSYGQMLVDTRLNT